jgi:hypothetical protein
MVSWCFAGAGMEPLDAMARLILAKVNWPVQIETLAPRLVGGSVRRNSVA